MGSTDYHPPVVISLLDEDIDDNSEDEIISLSTAYSQTYRFSVTDDNINEKIVAEKCSNNTSGSPLIISLLDESGSDEKTDGDSVQLLHRPICLSFSQVKKKHRNATKIRVPCDSDFYINDHTHTKNDFELVMRISKELEYIFVRFFGAPNHGGRGDSLHAKLRHVIRSIEGGLPKETENKIRYLITSMLPISINKIFYTKCIS